LAVSCNVSSASNSQPRSSTTYLRHLKQRLRDLHHIAQRLDVLDPRLDRIRMSASRRVEDVLDLLDLPFRPLLVHRSAVLEDAVEDAEQAEGYDRLFIHYVQLVADGPDGDAGPRAEDGGFADQRATGKGVDDRLGALLRVFCGDIRGVASC
jgi:hypothetical protein